MNKKKNKVILIITNIINKKNNIKKINKKIIKNKLSCCINYINNIKSYFIWKKKINKITETQIIIKTFKKFKNKIINIIKKNHIYKIPMIYTIKIKYINKKYLNWMKNIIN